MKTLSANGTNDNAVEWPSETENEFIYFYPHKYRGTVGFILSVAVLIPLYDFIFVQYEGVARRPTQNRT